MTENKSSGDSMTDAALDARLEALTRNATPPAAAWPAVAERIRAGEGRVRRRPGRIGALAAAAALVAVLAVTVVQQMPDGPGEPIDAGRVLVQAEAEAMRRAAPVATGGLVDALPLAESWAENQSAIDELEAALDRDPDNRLLLDFLAEARLRQVRLLNSGLVLDGRTDA